MQPQAVCHAAGWQACFNTPPQTGWGKTAASKCKHAHRNRVPVASRVLNATTACSAARALESCAAQGSAAARAPLCSNAAAARRRARAHGQVCCPRTAANLS